MAVIAGGIHVHVDMAVKGEEYVCMGRKAVYLAGTQVISDAHARHVGQACEFSQSRCQT